MTEEQYTEAVGRAGLTFADGVLAAARKEAKGCAPRWDKLTCWLKQIKAAQFALGDNVLYNIMLSIAGMNHSDADLDPSAQPPQGTTIIIVPNPQDQPAATEVLFSDGNWNDDHLVYTNIAWAGFVPQIYVNGQRFLQQGAEYTVLFAGGFVLTSPMIDGDIYYAIF